MAKYHECKKCGKGWDCVIDNCEVKTMIVCGHCDQINNYKNCHNALSKLTVGGKC